MLQHQTFVITLATLVLAATVATRPRCSYDSCGACGTLMLMQSEAFDTCVTQIGKEKDVMQFKPYSKCKYPKGKTIASRDLQNVLDLPGEKNVRSQDKLTGLMERNALGYDEDQLKDWQEIENNPHKQELKACLACKKMSCCFVRGDKSVTTLHDWLGPKTHSVAEACQKVRPGNMEWNPSSFTPSPLKDVGSLKSQTKKLYMCKDIGRSDECTLLPRKKLEAQSWQTQANMHLYGTYDTMDACQTDGQCKTDGNRKCDVRENGEAPSWAAFQEECRGENGTPVISDNLAQLREAAAAAREEQKTDNNLDASKIKTTCKCVPPQPPPPKNQKCLDVPKICEKDAKTPMLKREGFDLRTCDSPSCKPRECCIPRGRCSTLLSDKLDALCAAKPMWVKRKDVKNVVCTGAECNTDDCCKPRQKCKDLLKKQPAFCKKPQVPVINVDDVTCATEQCEQSECCGAKQFCKETEAGFCKASKMVNKITFDDIECDSTKCIDSECCGSPAACRRTPEFKFVQESGDPVTCTGAGKARKNNFDDISCEFDKCRVGECCGPKQKCDKALQLNDKLCTAQKMVPIGEPQNKVCETTTCTPADCCVGRGKCRKTLKDQPEFCSSQDMVKMPGYKQKTCASAKCEVPECCLPRDTCSKAGAELCTNSRWVQRQPIPAAKCAGAKCLKAECCDQPCSFWFGPNEDSRTKCGGGIRKWDWESKRCSNGVPCTLKECCEERKQTCDEFVCKAENGKQARNKKWEYWSSDNKQWYQFGPKQMYDWYSMGFMERGMWYQQKEGGTLIRGQDTFTNVAQNPFTCHGKTCTTGECCKDLPRCKATRGGTDFPCSKSNEYHMKPRNDYSTKICEASGCTKDACCEDIPTCSSSRFNCDAFSNLMKREDYEGKSCEAEHRGYPPTYDCNAGICCVSKPAPMTCQSAARSLWPNEPSSWYSDNIVSDKCRVVMGSMPRRARMDGPPDSTKLEKLRDGTFSPEAAKLWFGQCCIPNSCHQWKMYGDIYLGLHGTPDDGDPCNTNEYESYKFKSDPGRAHLGGHLALLAKDEESAKNTRCGNMVGTGKPKDDASNREGDCLEKCCNRRPKPDATCADVQNLGDFCAKEGLQRVVETPREVQLANIKAAAVNAYKQEKPAELRGKCCRSPKCGELPGALAAVRRNLRAGTPPGAPQISFCDSLTKGRSTNRENFDTNANAVPEKEILEFLESGPDYSKVPPTCCRKRIFCSIVGDLANWCDSVAMNPVDNAASMEVNRNMNRQEFNAKCCVARPPQAETCGVWQDRKYGGVCSSGAALMNIDMYPEASRFPLGGDVEKAEKMRDHLALGAKERFEGMAVTFEKDEDKADTSCPEPDEDNKCQGGKLNNILACCRPVIRCTKQFKCKTGVEDWRPNGDNKGEYGDPYDKADSYTHCGTSEKTGGTTKLCMAKDCCRSSSSSSDPEPGPEPEVESAPGRDVLVRCGSVINALFTSEFKVTDLNQYLRSPFGTAWRGGKLAAGSNPPRPGYKKFYEGFCNFQDDASFRHHYYTRPRATLRVKAMVSDQTYQKLQSVNTGEFSAAFARGMGQRGEYVNETGEKSISPSDGGDFVKALNAYYNTNFKHSQGIRRLKDTCCHVNTNHYRRF